MSTIGHKDSYIQTVSFLRFPFQLTFKVVTLRFIGLRDAMTGRAIEEDTFSRKMSSRLELAFSRDTLMIVLESQKVFTPNLNFPFQSALQGLSFLVENFAFQKFCLGNIKSKKNNDLFKKCRARTLFTFDEEERILIVSFLPKSPRGFCAWTSAAGIDRDARRFQRLGAILDWLTGTYSLDLMS